MLVRGHEVGDGMGLREQYGGTVRLGKDFWYGIDGGKTGKGLYQGKGARIFHMRVREFGRNGVGSFIIEHRHLSQY